jgi:glycosyltransferase domain-containing protein
MKLTIVLTLKDRSAFTYRWMKYMSDMRSPYKILIADGGKDSALEEHLRRGKDYPGLDYEYIRYPYDASAQEYLVKFADALSRVESEYILLADNDDFFLLERIPELLDFLDTHRDYAAARGSRVDLMLFGRGGRLSSLPTGRDYLAISKDAPSIEGACPLERVEELCRNMSRYDYHQNWYCVFRASLLKDEWSRLVRLPVRDLSVAEILTHVFVAMSGKIKVMPFPFFVRQSNTSMSGDTLVAGNRFLEDCLLTGSLSEFKVGVDHFFSDRSKEERERILRAIAGWLGPFISNIYASRKGFSGFKMRVKRSLIINRHVTGAYQRLIYPLYRMRRERPVRLKLLEPYLLSRGGDNEG